jgi:hypothetical protein
VRKVRIYSVSIRVPSIHSHSQSTSLLRKGTKGEHQNQHPTKTRRFNTLINQERPPKAPGTTMEVPNPHGGGLPSASRWAPLSGIQPPSTPTPTYRGASRVLEMSTDLELDLSNSEYSRAPSRASSRSSRSTQSAQGIWKRGQLGLSLDPGRNLHKQCQALVELLEN